MSQLAQATSINFLPGWYAGRAVSQRRRRRMLILGGVMVLAMAWAWIGLRGTASDLALQRAALEQREVAAQAQARHLAELQAQRQALLERVERYEQVVRPIDLHHVNAVLSTLTPEAVFLRGLSSEVVARKRKLSRKEKAAAEASGEKPKSRTVRTLLIELDGTAPSNLEIANYVGRLSAASLFENVQMIQAHEGRVGESTTRQFKIAMEVPLDRRYRFVDREGVGNAG